MLLGECAAWASTWRWSSLQLTAWAAPTALPSCVRGLGGASGLCQPVQRHGCSSKMFSESSDRSGPWAGVLRLQTWSVSAASH